MFKGGIILGGLGSGGLLSTLFLFWAGNAKNEKTRENFFNSVLDGRKIDIENLFKNRGGLFYAIPQGEKGIDGELKVIQSKENVKKENNKFSSGCEFVRNILGEDGNIKYLGERGRTIIEETEKKEEWSQNAVRVILNQESSSKGCLLDKILNSSNNEFRLHYLVNVGGFSKLKGQSGLINFGRENDERANLTSWGIYKSAKNFINEIKKIRIIEGKGMGRELTYDLYISPEWTKQLSDLEVKNDEEVLLSLAEFGPREGSEITEQKGMTNLIWTVNKKQWKFARFELGLAPAVKNFKNKVGYLEEQKCKNIESDFSSISDKELCKIGSLSTESQKWQIWFPEVLWELEKSNNNDGYQFEKGECKDLRDCIKKVIGNSDNKKNILGVWGEVGILDNNGGVRWRSF
ncbi:hypothetical protein [Mycoplasma parvum]|uniref:Uncharacterized protein n=1 Tax=Mycoplasma parvum str. Indiana TaxID=1403316 RepID=U5NCV9_9MOLU|nr:hypothetical protein [Mycoplasma parvum]AGX89175.1 hypothetical protein PRV_02185 [Mycoplasma parvum str. Indiana]